MPVCIELDLVLFVIVSCSDDFDMLTLSHRVLSRRATTHRDRHRDTNIDTRMGG